MRMSEAGRLFYIYIFYLRITCLFLFFWIMPHPLPPCVVLFFVMVLGISVLLFDFVFGWAGVGGVWCGVVKERKIDALES